MTEDELKRIREERTFLHDLANPLATILLLFEMLNDAGAPQSQEGSDSRQKIASLLSKIQTLLQERRKALIEAQSKIETQNKAAS